MQDDVTAPAAFNVIEPLAAQGDRLPFARAGGYGDFKLTARALDGVLGAEHRIRKLEGQ